MKKISIFIDTSIIGLNLFFTEYKSGKCIYKQAIVEKSQANKSLSVLVREGLVKVHAKLEDIASIFISTGPGSFTGIRVGLAWLYGFLSGLDQNIEVHGESSLKFALEYLSSSVKGKEDTFLLISDTMRSGYLAYMSKSGSIDLSQCSLEDLEVLSNKWKDSKQTIFIDKSWESASCLLSSKQLEHIQYSRLDISNFGVRAMIKQSESLKTSFDCVEPHPYYLKKSSVEERFENIAKELVV